MPQDQTANVIELTEAKKAEQAPQRVFKLSLGLDENEATAFGRAVVISNTVEAEDDFTDLYKRANNMAILEPPYNLKLLKELTQENNALSPCIETMVTNVAGTGFDFFEDGNTQPLPPDPDADIDPDRQALWDFFAEPWPGESFISIRKKVERDVNSIGNGYIEWLRNAKDDLTFCRYADGTLTRLVELDDPVTVEAEVRRRGEKVTIKVAKRERRYAMITNKKNIVYFKEFGSKRDLDKKTGKWAAKGERLPYNRRASEMMHFTGLPAMGSPYGVPKWISQLPSVLGSRKAEEFNLEFFDNGGVPPVMIMLQGGVMSNVTRTAIDNQNNKKAAKKQRIMVIEAEPTGGSLDSVGTAKVTVERFGSERQSDSMFEKYDANCEIRVRRSWRIPALFTGGTEGQSFATAYTAIMQTEAQVFKPDRDEFDEVMNIRVLPEFNLTKPYLFKSLPLNVLDAAMRLKGIELAGTTGHLDGQDTIREINQTVGTNLKASKTPGLPFGKTTTGVPDASVNPQTGLPYANNQPTETAFNE